MSVVSQTSVGSVDLVDAWLAVQRQPLSQALLGASLRDVFGSPAPRPQAGAGGSAAHLVDDLIRLALHHQAVQHPYLHALGSGNLPDLSFALHDFARHYSGYVNHMVRFQVALMGRLRDPAHRAALLQSSLAGAPPQTLFRPFRQALGLADEFGDAGDFPAIEVVCWREQQLSLLQSGSVAEAVGALLLGSEAIQSTTAQPFLEATDRLGLAPHAVAFFALPASSGDTLPALLRPIILDFARTAQGQIALVKGMHKALALRAAFWAWLHQRALSLSAMQA